MRILEFFHNYHPARILFEAGPLVVYWYGLFIILGMLAGIFVTIKIGNKQGFKKELVFDIVFWMIVWGIIGARAYHVGLEIDYYFKNPFEIIKVWHGGLAIHGAIAADVIVLYYFSKKNQLDFWPLFSIIATGLALGQAIGRWGNYFNQELFGRPTASMLGIPIDRINRPVEHIGSNYFHPAFLYESAADFLLFLVLIFLHHTNRGRDAKKAKIISGVYLCGYAVIRFIMEMIRVDETPAVFGLRAPQAASIIIFIFGARLMYRGRKN
jgi:phosphatidylglycerol---prolipoprotein diacylglyceryl transferase